MARSWLDLLREPAEAERAAAHARVADALQRPTMTATVLGLAAWGAPDNEAMRIQLVHGGQSWWSDWAEGRASRPQYRGPLR